MTRPRTRNEKLMRKRLRWACVVVAVALLAVFAIEVVWKLAQTGTLQEATNPALWEEEGERIEGMLVDSGQAAALPQAFEEEVGTLEEYSEVRVDDRGGIVGFTVDRGSDETSTSIASELEEKGWTAMAGEAGCTSFVKSEGSYRWLFVSCVPVGNATSVVMQICPSAK